MARTVSLKQRLAHEVKAVGLAALYFGCWLATLLVMKKLVLAEYHIEFDGVSKALVGALILSKVVLLLEHVPLGAWVRGGPAWVDVLLRTALYSLGLIAVLLLEKAFDGRHEHGGLGPSLGAVFQHPDMPHVWVNAIAFTGALLFYNVLSVVRAHLGEGGVWRLFLKPVPGERAN